MGHRLLNGSSTLIERLSPSSIIRQDTCQRKHKERIEVSGQDSQEAEGSQPRRRVPQTTASTRSNVLTAKAKNKSHLTLVLFHLDETKKKREDDKKKRRRQQQRLGTRVEPLTTFGRAMGNAATTKKGDPTENGKVAPSSSHSSRTC